MSFDNWAGLVQIAAGIATIGSFVHGVLTKESRGKFLTLAGFFLVTAIVGTKLLQFNKPPVQPPVGTPTPQKTVPKPDGTSASTNTSTPSAPLAGSAKETPQTKIFQVPPPITPALEESKSTATLPPPSKPCPEFRRLSKRIVWKYQQGGTREVILPIVTPGDHFEPWGNETCKVKVESGAQSIQLNNRPAMEQCKQIEFSVVDEREPFVLFDLTLSGCPK